MRQDSRQIDLHILLYHIHIIDIKYIPTFFSLSTSTPYMWCIYIPTHIYYLSRDIYGFIQTVTECLS